MNIKIDKSNTFDTEPEIIIHCREIDEKVQKILSLLDMQKKKLLGFIEQTEHVIEPKEVLYCESVEGIVFIYTETQVYKSAYILSEIENVFSEVGFFRCSKSMVLNINSVKSLKSEFGNRIDALLSNSEHIIISRQKQIKMVRQFSFPHMCCQRYKITVTMQQLLKKEKLLLRILLVILQRPMHGKFYFEV